MSILLTLGDATDNEAEGTQSGPSISPRSISGSSAQPSDSTTSKAVVAPTTLPEKPASIHEASVHTQSSAKKSNHPIPVPPSRPTKGHSPSTPSSPSSHASPIAEVSSASPPAASPHIDKPTAGAEAAATNSIKTAHPASLILLPDTPPPNSELSEHNADKAPSPRHAEARDRAHTVAAPSSSGRLSGKPFGAESPVSGTNKPQTTADGRILPARPVAVNRRPNRPGAQTARGALSIPHEDTADKDDSPSPHVHFDEPTPMFKSREFEDVLSKPTPQISSAPSSPRKLEPIAPTTSIFDPKNPFEIEEMAQHVDSPKVAPHTLKVRPPAPPVITEPVIPPRPAHRTGSVPLSSNKQRIIPKPPSTTPAATAPLVVPRIPVAVDGHHNLSHGHHIEDAEKKAKRERKEAEKPPRPPVPKRGLSMSQLTASGSTITPSSSSSSISTISENLELAEASASESGTSLTAVPVLTPSPVFELNQELKTAGPRTGLSKSSADVAPTKKITQTNASSSAVPAVSFEKIEKLEKKEKHEKHEKHEKKDKTVKDKEKEKEKEKDDKKSGILSILSSKLTLRGKKHDKPEFEAVEEESESDSQSGPPDPLLHPQLSPAVTPREGLMYNPNHPANVVASQQATSNAPHIIGDKIEDLDSALADLPASTVSPSSTGEIPELGSASAEGHSTSELESHKNVLLGQIRHMEDLHRRLREAISDEQATLASTRKHGRSRSKSIGSPVAHSAVSPTVKRKADKSDKSEKSDKKDKDAASAASTPLSPRSKPTSPALSKREVPVTANTPQRFPSIAGLKIPQGDVTTIFGFKQKLGRSETRGDVYACRHLKSGLLVTVRVTPLKDETQYDEIRTRAKTVLILENERLATVMHTQIVSNELWTVSQYCPIGSLRTMLETHSLVLTEGSIRVIARSALVGLSFLHRSKLTHGSLSLSNVLVDSYADVKLCDYSLHTILGEESSKASFEAQCRADLHALAVILVQMADWEHLPLDHESSASTNLAEPTKFTTDFNDFIEACAFAEQPAATLLAHPFLTSHASTQSLVDAVAVALSTLRASTPAETANAHPTVTREELDERYKSKALSPAVSKIRIHERNESLSDSGDAHSLSEVVSPAVTQRITNLKSKIDESIEKSLVGASEETQKIVQALRAAIFEATEEVLSPAQR